MHGIVSQLVALVMAPVTTKKALSLMSIQDERREGRKEGGIGSGEAGRE